MIRPDPLAGPLRGLPSKSELRMLNLQWSVQIFPKTLILLERKKDNENAHQKWTSSPGLFQDEKRRWKSQIVPARLA